MKIILILATLFIANTISFSLDQNEIELGRTSMNGVTYSLIVQDDGVSAGIFVIKHEDGKEETVAGDSSPFPLSNYGIEEDLAVKLAGIFVEAELQSYPNGIQDLREQVAQRQKLPHDLAQAYSKYTEVNCRLVYGTNKRDLSDMVQSLKALIAAASEDEAHFAEHQLVRPLFNDIAIRMADKPDHDLARVLLSATATYPNNEVLQEIVGIYAGRQQQHFELQYDSLPSEQKHFVLKALSGAVKKDLVAFDVKARVNYTLQNK